MADHIMVLGKYDEILLVAERVIAIDGIPETRGDIVILSSVTGEPKFVGAQVSLDTGQHFEVPQPPQEVARRRYEAITRAGMLPEGWLP